MAKFSNFFATIFSLNRLRILRIEELGSGRNSRGRYIHLVLLFLFYLPVLTILTRAFLAGNALVNLWSFLKSPLFANTLSFSLAEAFLSAFFSLLLAFPGAYFFGRYNFPGKPLIRSLLVLPFMLPGILVVLGMVVFYGRNGTLNSLLARMFPASGWKFTGLYGFWGIILAHVFYNFTFCLRVLGESWERIDPKLREASAILGGGPFLTFTRITLPLLAPTIAYLFTLVFLYSFLSFTVVLVLGGYLYKTFEVLIYIEYNVRFQFGRAALIATIQILLLAGVLYLQAFFGRRSARHSYVGELPRLRFKNNPAAVVIALIYLVLTALFFLSPVCAVLVRSFNERGLPGGPFTLENYLLLFTEGFRFTVGVRFLAVLGTSLLLAVTVAFLTVGLAYFLARARRNRSWGKTDLWLQLPLGVSFLTFAFGVMLLAGKVLPSWLLIIWAQLFLAFPLIYSLLRTARRELGEGVLEAAATLGASPAGVFWTIEFPLMKRAIGTAMAYAMAFSLGDLAAVLVLGRGEVVTLSVAIYRLIGHYRFAQATALGTIFILLSLLIFLGIETRYQPGVADLRDSC